MDYDPDFVYYTVMTRSEDQRLNLSMDRYSHIYIFCRLFTDVFYVYAVYFFMKNLLNANPRCN